MISARVTTFHPRCDTREDIIFIQEVFTCFDTGVVNCKLLYPEVVPIYEVHSSLRVNEMAFSTGITREYKT